MSGASPCARSTGSTARKARQKRTGVQAQLADDDRPDAEGGGPTNGTVRRLVIVESPTKARKIAGYLGPNYIVESSRGHIRDLPRVAADVPSKFKSEPWARLGVNVDHDFEPLYVVSPDKKATVTDWPVDIKVFRLVPDDPRKFTVQLADALLV